MTAEENLSPAITHKMERIVDFAPDRLRAPFALRCAALFIDYMVLLAAPVVWLIFEKLMNDAGTPITVGGYIWFLGGLLWLVDFLLLPLFRGQTLGKMLTGITIVNRDGTSITLVTILLRNVLGYLLTAVTLGLGFLIAAVNPSGRALHDYVGGTVVVRARKRPRPA